MLWIVGFWHLSNYYKFDVEGLNVITNGVLALFFFISARLSARKVLVTVSDSINYLKKRLISLYPLLFISGVTLWFFGFYNTKFDLISNLLCISPLYNNVTQTIWFAIILVLFYIITPVFISNITIKSKVLFAVIIYAVLVYERLFIKAFDYRISEYISVYFLGLIIPEKLYRLLINKWYNCVIGIIGFIGLIITPNNVPVLFTFLSNLFFVISAMYICKKVSQISFLAKVFYYVSMSATCAYFFHRQIYGLLAIVIPATPVTAYLIYLPFVLIVSYFLQLGYNCIIKAVLNSNKIIIPPNR